MQARTTVSTSCRIRACCYAVRIRFNMFNTKEYFASDSDHIDQVAPLAFGSGTLISGVLMLGSTRFGVNVIELCSVTVLVNEEGCIG